MATTAVAQDHPYLSSGRSLVGGGLSLPRFAVETNLLRAVVSTNRNRGKRTTVDNSVNSTTEDHAFTAQLELIN